MLAEATKLKTMILGPKEIFKLLREGAVFGERAGRIIMFLLATLWSSTTPPAPLPPSK